VCGDNGSSRTQRRRRGRSMGEHNLVHDIATSITQARYVTCKLKVTIKEVTLKMQVMSI
jgi:hypothetical protein